MRTTLSDRGENGSILVDALIALSVAAVLLPAVLGLIGRVSRSAAGIEDHVVRRVSDRNTDVLERFVPYRSE